MSSPTLSLRSLAPSDLGQLEALFLNAPADDRSTRFCGGVSDAYVQHYVTTVAAEATELLGAFEAEKLVGVAEVFLTGECAELAFLVSRDAQRQGLGKRLMAGAISAAQQRGGHRATVITSADNRSMQRLAQAGGMVRDRAADDWSAFMDFDGDCDSHLPSVYQLMAA